MTSQPRRRSVALVVSLLFCSIDASFIVQSSVIRRQAHVGRNHRSKNGGFRSRRRSAPKKHDKLKCRDCTCTNNNAMKDEENDGDMLATTTSGENSASSSEASLSSSVMFALTVCLLLSGGSVAIHAGGWGHFISSLAEMKAQSTPEEFSSAIKFWSFAALAHPILQPVLWISEVLHGSPGPTIFADLVPVSFLAGSAAVAYALIAYEQLSQLVGAVLFVSLINYIGLGLDGRTTALLGDYNIQLDDDYRGRVVKGCPSPREVQSVAFVQAYANEFDYGKYQGRWYWHKVHDWTQFKEMYDTTLDIAPTDGGYVNTLSLKGPSPQSSPLSWDKSPLLNGAKYSWAGQVDKNGPPGVSLEKGFGVTFPNYIIDVKTDPKTGEYSELIQFQCIEVGGVRLYEGIDFMSRSPYMTDQELDEMHRRAHESGLDPYGSSPEQMHRIVVRGQQQSPAQGTESNPWQRMWKRLGVDQLLDQSLTP